VSVLARVVCRECALPDIAAVLVAWVAELVSPWIVLVLYSPQFASALERASTNRLLLFFLFLLLLLFEGDVEGELEAGVLAPLAAYSHSASVGRRPPTHLQYATASFHDICVTG
jgi:hypothetical protein